MEWAPGKTHADRERWICIYPAYINSKKTCTQGRRLAKEKCVDNPTYQEMKDVLLAAGCTIGVENKVYPREINKYDTQFRGRIRMQLKNEDGSPLIANFPTRDSVLLYLGETIPKLKSRVQKQGDSSSNQPSGSKDKGKGKGKGKKR